MRRFASAGMVVAIVCGLVAVTGDAASARAHRHRRNHQPCGPGTARARGVCTPISPKTPTPAVGNSNVSIVPSTVTLNEQGQFIALAIVTGLPPRIRVSAPPDLRCGPAAKIRVVVPAGINVNDAGRLEATVSDDGGAGGCLPGQYPIIFNASTPPFVSVTGFITLR